MGVGAASITRTFSSSCLTDQGPRRPTLFLWLLPGLPPRARLCYDKGEPLPLMQQQRDPPHENHGKPRSLPPTAFVEQPAGAHSLFFQAGVANDLTLTERFMACGFCLLTRAEVEEKHHYKVQGARPPSGKKPPRHSRRSCARPAMERTMLVMRSPDRLQPV